MKEWKQIVIDNEKWNYEVSTEGRVRSLNYYGHGKIQELKQQEEKNGYLKVHLSKNGKEKYFYVHRLVATMFIPNPHNCTDVDHIDKNRQNNHVSNLRWLSHKNNIYHSNVKRVKCIETGKIYDSIKQASEETGLPFQNISECCRGKRKSCGKLHWEFMEQ